MNIKSWGADPEIERLDWQLCEMVKKVARTGPQFQENSYTLLV
jgi:hypothetical protein